MSAAAWNILFDAQIELLQLQRSVVVAEVSREPDADINGTTISEMSDQAEALKLRLTQFQKAIDPAT